MQVVLRWIISQLRACGCTSTDRTPGKAESSGEHSALQHVYFLLMSLQTGAQDAPCPGDIPGQERADERDERSDENRHLWKEKEAPSERGISQKHQEVTSPPLRCYLVVFHQASRLRSDGKQRNLKYKPGL